MAKQEKARVEKGPADLPLKTFTVAECCSQLGNMNRRTFFRLVKQCDVSPVKVNGRPQYTQEAIDELKEEKQDDLPEDDVLPVSELIRQSVDHSKQMSAHNEALLKLVTDPSAALAEAMRAQFADLTSYVQKLQQKYHDLLQISETALSKAHERELASMKALRSEDRFDQLFVELKKYAPHLVSGAVGYLKGDRASGLGPLLLTLAENLGPEHKAELANLIMKLPDEGKKAGMRVLDQLQKALAEKEKAAKEEGKKRNGKPPVRPAPKNGEAKNAEGEGSTTPSEPEPESPELDAMLEVSSLSDDDLAKLPDAARAAVTKARDAARAIKAEKPS